MSTNDPEKPAPLPNSLWPTNIDTQPKIVTPSAILKEQASILSQMVRNILRGAVRQFQVEDEFTPKLHYAFTIVAPALNNYSVELFTIEHDATKLYPLKLESRFLPPPRQSELTLTINDEESFRASIRELFADKRTTDAISALLAQSRH